MVGRAFSSMPGLASSIARDIRDGTIKKYLLQPVDMLGFVLMSRLAHKLVYYGVAIAPFALVFWLCRGFFSGWPDAWTMLAFIASLVMSFLLGFFLEATLGMIGFWFLEVSSLLFVYMLVSFFFSGQMFPPEIMPSYWPTVMKIIPLQYLAYFPAAVFLHKVDRGRVGLGAGGRGLLGGVLLLRGPHDVPLRRAALQRLRRLIGMGNAAAYFRVFLTFARNSLVRDMTFRGNFIIDSISSLAWVFRTWSCICRYSASPIRSARTPAGSSTSSTSSSPPAW